MCWWWNVDGVAGSAAAYPILAATRFAGLFVCAADAAHEARVGLVEKAHREGESAFAGELFAGVGERVEVVADLFDVGVVCGRGVGGGGLVGEEVDEGGLCAFDLRGEYGLFAYEGVDEPVE